MTHHATCDLATNAGFACTCNPLYGWTTTWSITDTLAVPVEVLNLTDDGRAFIRAASGTKWVPTSELNLGGRA